MASGSLLGEDRAQAKEMGKMSERITVFSVYKEGGGTPFDSLWFSQEASKKQGVELELHHTGDVAGGIQAIRNADRVLFDGYSSLAYLESKKLLTACLKRKVPVGIYWHETDWYFKNWPLNGEKPSYWPPQRFLRYRAKLMPLYRLLKQSQTVHFHVCDYGINMMSRLGYKPERIHPLKNITGAYQDVLDMPLGEDTVPYRVVGLSKVDARKRPDLFMQVARYVIDRQPEAEFYFIGRFTETPFDQETIEKQVAELGITGKMHFVGEQRPPFPLLNTAQVFLHTAQDDPSPKVVMEALALGKAVAAFDVGGIGEILGSSEGLVPFGEVEALGEEILASFQRMTPKYEAERLAHFQQQFTPEAFASRLRSAVDWWIARTK